MKHRLPFSYWETRQQMLELILICLETFLRCRSWLQWLRSVAVLDFGGQGLGFLSAFSSLSLIAFELYFFF
ncbi:hypothetical protein CDL12_02500 [Handroanthus impetiginosus]|uniref:Uncharacterized protein n=1 Tax=Handroanthus impetiginosus TaxID=429701 RepID=A0A2G9I4R6_9LAMI|nr:hypothetical protein CDL12_02500 [Handroanthus impetiginosus]